MTKPVETESNRLLLEALAKLHEAVVLIDCEGRIMWRSDGFAQLCASDQPLEGLPWRELLMTPTDADQLFEKLLRVGRLLNEPVKIAGASGDLVPVLATIVPLGRDPKTSPTMAILRRDQADDPVDLEMRHATRSVRHVLASSSDPVVVCDRRGFITYANDAVERLLGFSPADIVDKPLALFLHGRADLQRITEALSPDNPVHEQDLELRCKDGTALSVSLSATLLLRTDGSYVGAVAFLRDVTDKRRSEEALARKNAELEHYVHAISHDLRSPLVSLLGFSRLLRDDYGESLDDKGRHFLDRIEEAGRTMESLIHHLRELSRIGQTGERKTWVDVRSVLLQLRAELKPRMDDSGTELKIPDDPPLVQCDRTRLYQLFSNLIGNAIDHMGETPDPTIQVELTEAADHHVVVVRDNGQGIAPQHHERIFELFESLSAGTDGHRNTGIGLAIVKKIAETHGGRCWVESQPGEGAAFYVTLPRS